MSHRSGASTIDYADHHDRGDDAAKHIHNHDDDLSGSLPPLRVELALDSDQRALPSPHHLPPQQAVQVQQTLEILAMLTRVVVITLRQKVKKNFLSVSGYSPPIFRGHPFTSQI